MNIPEYNSRAWDECAKNGIEWSLPVSPAAIEQARRGNWSVILTPLKPVPRPWFGDIRGQDVLCLASGGGQQAPILAAAGARVVSFDNSAQQLALDQEVAAREKLDIQIEQGDAADLSRFDDATFDLIFHPCSNCFMERIEPIWHECCRVLRPGGTLMAGFNQPLNYIFDRAAEARGVLQVRHALPYADLTSLTETELAAQIAKHEPLEFSHTLEAQIGGQIAAGFLIAGFYEDSRRDGVSPLNHYTPTFIATRAIKPGPA